jgi:cytochrome b6-f complex iron-sulfur subunit
MNDEHPHEPVETLTEAPVLDTEDDQQPEQLSRRRFISLFGVAWTVFTATFIAGTALVVRFFYPNVSSEPPLQFRAGTLSDYPPNQVDERFKESQRTWIVNDGRAIYAFAAICTHLGCTPNWIAGEEKFKCPCHGSGFHMNGRNFEGPAPRPLDRYRIVLAEDGQLLVDKSRLFRYDLGEWNHPESSVQL